MSACILMSTGLYYSSHQLQPQLHPRPKGATNEALLIIEFI